LASAIIPKKFETFVNEPEFGRERKRQGRQGITSSIEVGNVIVEASESILGAAPNTAECSILSPIVDCTHHS
jgi:hypothetical protein